MRLLFSFCGMALMGMLATFSLAAESSPPQATGFFQVEQSAGRWYLIDPQGHRFISTGVTTVCTLEKVGKVMAPEASMARPSVSEHLRALRESGLVEERQEGRHRFYRVTGEPMAELIDWLSPYERFWRNRMSALGDVLDRLGDDD